MLSIVVANTRPVGRQYTRLHVIIDIDNLLNTKAPVVGADGLLDT